jgi:hypothetical protein
VSSHNNLHFCTFGKRKNVIKKIFIASRSKLCQICDFGLKKITVWQPLTLPHSYVWRVLRPVAAIIWRPQKVRPSFLSGLRLSAASVS